MRRGICAVLLIFSGLGLAQGFAPRDPECIAPAEAESGWDAFCRAVTRLMSELGIVSQPFKVTNLSGGDGGAAFAGVVSQRDADPNLIVAAGADTALRLAQGRYSRFTEQDVRWVGAVAADYGVIAVKTDAPWKTLGDFAEVWKADPSKVTVGGVGPAGDPDQIKTLLLARAAGIALESVRYAPSENSDQAVAALRGGFVQAIAGNASALRGPLEAGAIRVLGVMSPRRLGAPYADVPTLREQGFDAEWIGWQGFYMPRSASPQGYAFWVQALRRVAASPQWAEVRQENRLGEFVLFGPQFQVFVERQVNELRNLSRALGTGR